MNGSLAEAGHACSPVSLGASRSSGAEEGPSEVVSPSHMPEGAPDDLMELARVIYDLCADARRMGRETQGNAVTAVATT